MKTIRHSINISNYLDNFSPENFTAGEVFGETPKPDEFDAIIRTMINADIVDGPLAPLSYAICRGAANIKQSSKDWDMFHAITGFGERIDNALALLDEVDKLGAHLFKDAAFYTREGAIKSGHLVLHVFNEISRRLWTAMQLFSETIAHWARTLANSEGTVVSCQPAEPYQINSAVYLINELTNVINTITSIASYVAHQRQHFFEFYAGAD